MKAERHRNAALPDKLTFRDASLKDKSRQEVSTPINGIFLFSSFLSRASRWGTASFSRKAGRGGYGCPLAMNDRIAALDERPQPSGSPRRGDDVLRYFPFSFFFSPFRKRRKDGFVGARRSSSAPRVRDPDAESEGCDLTSEE